MGSVRPVFGSVIVFGVSLGLANVAYYLSVTRLPVAIAIMIQYTAPALVVLGLAIASRSLPARPIVLALSATFAGVALLAGLTAGGGTIDTLGLGYSVLAAIGFAGYIVVGERVTRELGALRALRAGFAVSGLGWIVVQAIRGAPTTLVDARFVGWALFLGIACTAVPFFLFLSGMARVGASRAGIISTVEPVSAAVMSWIALGQVLSPIQLLGGGLILVGVAIVRR